MGSGLSRQVCRRGTSPALQQSLSLVPWQPRRPQQQHRGSLNPVQWSAVGYSQLWGQVDHLWEGSNRTSLSSLHWKASKGKLAPSHENYGVIPIPECSWILRNHLLRLYSSLHISFKNCSRPDWNYKGMAWWHDRLDTKSRNMPQAIGVIASQTWNWRPDELDLDMVTQAALQWHNWGWPADMVRRRVDFS